MSDSVALVRAAAQAIGLKLPEERVEKIAAEVESTIRRVDAIRGETTPMPSPSSFDASWSEKR